MAKKRIPDSEGNAALANLETQAPTATRYLLQQLETLYPGGTIELRVPPYGAVQLVGGLNHRRGTPPNVVELDPDSFIAMSQGKVSWMELVESGKLIASGARAIELKELFPIAEVR